MSHESCCEECGVAREHLIAESAVYLCRRRVDSYGLTFAALQYRASVKARDQEAASHWAWELVEASGVASLTDEQECAIVDRHFADLIVNAAVPSQ